MNRFIYSLIVAGQKMLPGEPSFNPFSINYPSCVREVSDVRQKRLMLSKHSRDDRCCSEHSRDSLSVFNNRICFFIGAKSGEDENS